MVRNPDKLKGVPKENIFKAVHNCEEDTVNAIKGVEKIVSGEGDENERQ